MALNLNSITEIFTKQESPRFEVGSYAEFEGLVGEIISIGEHPYTCDGSEAIRVIGVTPDGEAFDEYWPTGRTIERHEFHPGDSVMVTDWNIGGAYEYPAVVKRVVSSGELVVCPYLAHKPERPFNPPQYAYTHNVRPATRVFRGVQ